MNKAAYILLTLAIAYVGTASGETNSTPLRVGIIGLVHGHAAGFLGGGALAPAGGLMHRADVQLVGVVEPDDQLFQRYAVKFGWPASLHFHSVKELAQKAHPQAALLFTSTAGHRAAVEECAALGIHVMMEKPMAVSYQDALAMAEAARRGHVHVLVDYETSWYASVKGAHDELQQGKLGTITKLVARDGHEGPVKIHVQPEFLKWLTDPKENGAGALYDFGCYGADLMTWLMQGEAPVSVTAITKHLQPDLYREVDDEADILVNYKNAVAILQASWDWPFGVKDMDLYGATGYAKAAGPSQLEVRHAGDKAGQVAQPSKPEAPYDDPLHYLEAVISGQIEEGNDVSSLKTNVTVSEILDAARRSAQTGRTIALPLDAIGSRR